MKQIKMLKDAMKNNYIVPAFNFANFEILKGLVDNTKPKLVVVIDALASRSIERVSSSIQISDTGIVPGAGVGNTRKEISKATLGIPVIAIGIPTVVDLRNDNR